jgi:hypothetical protein
MSPARRAQLLIADSIPEAIEGLAAAVGRAEPKMVW